MMERSPHSHNPDKCYQERIQELAESCDHEFHMSALPSASNRSRAERGRNRILRALDELREIQRNTKCVACSEEIKRQVALQEAGIIEIEQAWNM